MLKVEISKDARDYILKRTGAITVKLILYSGCGGCVNEPTVSEGKPSEPESYDLVIVDGIEVYIFKEAVVAPEGIKISLPLDWRINLQVDGLIYEKPM